jgi:hypothetical protein
MKILSGETQELLPKKIILRPISLFIPSLFCVMFFKVILISYKYPMTLHLLDLHKYLTSLCFLSIHIPAYFLFKKATPPEQSKSSSASSLPSTPMVCRTYSAKQNKNKTKTKTKKKKNQNQNTNTKTKTQTPKPKHKRQNQNTNTKTKTQTPKPKHKHQKK